MRWVGSLVRWGAWLGALSIAAIAALVDYDVAARALGYPLLWSLEVTGYLMIGASVLAAGETLKDNGHFQMRLVVEMLRPRIQAMIDVVANLVAVLFMAGVSYGCLAMMMHAHRLGMHSSTMLRVPLVYPQAVLLAGLVLLVLAFCQCLLGSVRALRG